MCRWPSEDKQRDGSGVTNEWILEHVMTHGRSKVDDLVAAVLGMALLWYAFTAEGIRDMPVPLYQRIRDAYATTLMVRNGLEASTNPVRKIPVIVSGDDGEVYINEIPDTNAPGNEDAGPSGGNAAGMGDGGFINRPLREQLLAMHSHLLSLRRSDDEIRESVQNLAIHSTRQYQTLNANVRQVAVNPACQLAAVARNNGGMEGGQNGVVAVEGGGPVASLSPTPRDLYQLWQEFQVGIGGEEASWAVFEC